MIPKVIHLCWFSNDPFPVEIKVCIDTWKRLLPDYTIKRWTYEDAAAMNCAFVNEALAERKWTYAADVIRFYALLKDGGIYMDSDIFLKKRFDDLEGQSILQGYGGPL
jgi:mannosyltransferase OCH1-like enzyme